MNQRFLIHHTIIIHIKKKGNAANGAQITQGFQPPSMKSFRISTIAHAFSRCAALLCLNQNAHWTDAPPLNPLRFPCQP